VIDSAPEVEEAMLALFEEYSKLLEIRVPYNSEGFLDARPTAIGTFNRAIFETTELTHVFRTIKEVKRVEVQRPGSPMPVAGIHERTSFERWIEDKNV
jgi:hypothetical protein